RLDAEKGVALAAAAAQQVHLPIVFVGDGPLRQTIERAGARVTGWLAAKDVPQQIAQARCLAFPSLWYETYGLVADEAAARGVPAIVSAVSAAAERIIPGKTGWVFRSGSVEELAHCMGLTRDGDAIRAAGTAAYRRYWENPSTPSRHANELAAIY